MLDDELNLANKETIHILQNFFQCCAIDGYKDWILADQREFSGAKRQLYASGYKWNHCTSFGCYLPHSCCRNNQINCSPRILFQNLTINTAVGPQRTLQWFHSEGCVDAVRNHLNPLYFLSFSVFNLFLVIVCFMFTQIAATGYYAVEKCAAWEESILPAWIITFFSPHPNKIMQAYIMNIC
ncbi:unnamed protein product [Dracunculus medinensis]|uniref:Tetraspanin n=1 Tax=Dracunculus medinensis TaxID=318479 RepID=A0A0N4URT1_DRAME|nr:unnamed protein product [Dracunculus medinensis]